MLIDVHSHTFNADDVPVRGFVERVGFDDPGLGRAVGHVMDRLTQRAAPDFATENAVLDAMLADGPAAAAGVAPSGDVAAKVEQEAGEALRELRARAPALEAAAGDGFVRRALRWISLFTRSRLDITRFLLANPDCEVHLLCPLLVDLDSGLGDTANTTLRQQVVLHEKISRLSMLGRLDARRHTRVHPFVAFDPRRAVSARLTPGMETPLELAKEAVHEHGFVGVKVYPPMGWRPLGNAPSPGVPPSEASRLDAVLRELYSWCQEEQVPITAHCNDSNHAHVAYREFASPEHWLAVLREFPDLRLNLGHFGGGIPDDPWAWQIARAADSFEHLYADVGNHHLPETGGAPYVEMLQRMFDDASTQRMRDRLMIGSDMYMSAVHPASGRFLSGYVDLFARRFGEAGAEAFGGATARRFLGFNDAGNRNARRLAARYRRYAPEALPTWLAV